MSPKGEVETSFEQFSDLETDTSDTGFGNSQKQSFLLWTLSILIYLRTNHTIIITITTIISLIKIYSSKRTFIKLNYHFCSCQTRQIHLKAYYGSFTFDMIKLILLLKYDFSKFCSWEGTLCG